MIFAILQTKLRESFEYLQRDKDTKISLDNCHFYLDRHILNSETSANRLIPGQGLGQVVRESSG